MFGHPIETIGPAAENRADAVLHPDRFRRLLHTVHHRHYRPQ